MKKLANALGLLSFIVMAGAVGNEDYMSEIRYEYPITETIYSLMLVAVLAMAAVLVYFWRHR